MRGCLWALISLLSPRIIILGLFLFSHYLSVAYTGVWKLWPILGFLFMPITVLAYAIAENEIGTRNALWYGVIAVAVILDLGLIGGGSWGLRLKERRAWRKKPDEPKVEVIDRP